MKKMFLMAMLLVFQLPAVKSQEYKFTKGDHGRTQELTCTVEAETLSDKGDYVIRDMWYKYHPDMTVNNKKKDFYNLLIASTNMDKFIESLNKFKKPLGKKLFGFNIKKYTKGLKKAQKNGNELAYKKEAFTSCMSFADSIISQYGEKYHRKITLDMLVDENDTIVEYFVMPIMPDELPKTYVDEYGIGRFGEFAVDIYTFCKLRLRNDPKKVYQTYLDKSIEYSRPVYHSVRYSNGDQLVFSHDHVQENGYLRNLIIDKYAHDIIVHEAHITKDDGKVLKLNNEQCEIVYPNGDRVINPDVDWIYYLTNHNTDMVSGKIIKADGTQDYLYNTGETRSEIEAKERAEQARKKAEEERRAKEAAERKERERKELIEQYGQKYAEAALAGDLVKGMPASLVDIIFNKIGVKYIDGTRWDDGTTRFDLVMPLKELVGESPYVGRIWFTKDGKLSSWVLYQ